MNTPASPQELDPQQLALAGWGAAVPIAEILRQKTIDRICSTIHRYWMTEVLTRCGGTLAEARTNLEEGYGQKGWSDAPHMLALHMTRNLLRQLPPEEFIAESPQDFLRHYGLDDDREVPDDVVELCGLTNYDFWYGMLPEGSDIIASADGILRVRSRVMEVEGVTENQLSTKAGLAEEIGSAIDERTREVAEQGIRTILGQQFACGSLLERDRRIDAVDHILTSAADKLCEIIRQEQRQRRPKAPDDDGDPSFS